MPRYSTRSASGRFGTPSSSLLESELLPTPISHSLPETPVLNLHLEQYENIFVTPKGPIVPLSGTPQTTTTRRLRDTPYRRNTPPTIHYKAESPPPLVPASAPTVVVSYLPASAPDVVDLSQSPALPDGYAEISSADSSAEKPSLTGDLKELFGAQNAVNDPFAVPCLGRKHSGSMYYNSARTFHNVRDIEMVKYFKKGLFSSMLPMNPDYDTICFTITSRHRNLADISLRSTLDWKLLHEWNKNLIGTPERPLTRSSNLEAGIQIWTPIPARLGDWLKSKDMHDMLLVAPRV